MCPGKVTGFSGPENHSFKISAPKSGIWLIPILQSIYIYIVAYLYLYYSRSISILESIDIYICSKTYLYGGEFLIGEMVPIDFWPPARRAQNSQ